MAHTHNVYDSDPYFVIDVDTRTITDQSETGTSLMQYDHNSERITFEIPRTIEEHDMFVCDRVEIHYINIGTDGTRSEDVYEVDDLTVDSEDNELLLFTWLVSQNATMHAGSLSFIVRFICTTDGKFDYVWNTAIYNSIPVGNGMNNADAVVSQYSDILGAWYNELLGYGGKVAKEIAPTLEAEIEAEKLAAIEAIKVQADEIVNLVLERMPQAEDQILGTIPQAEEASF